MDEIKAIKEAYAALNRNDIQAFVQIFDPQIERVEPGDFPGDGAYQGLAVVTAHVEKARGTWAEGSCEPERFTVVGDRIIVSVKVRVRLKQETEWRKGWATDIFTFRNGKVTQFRTFFDERQAFEWAGIKVSDFTSARTIILTPDAGDRFSIIGGGVRVLIDGAASGGQCCVFECPIPVGEGPPLHKHEREDELFYVIEGRIKFSVDGKEFVGEKGAFACAPRGSVHAFRNVGTAVALLLVTCTPAGLEIPFRAVRDPEPGSGLEKPTPEQVMAEFAKHGITFVGPPLSGDN